MRIDLVETASTNSAMDADAPHGTVVSAYSQTAGRGQRGNSWESAPGLNATFSIMLRPRNMRPDEQFAVSEAVALGVADVVERYVGPDSVAVKWPNDVYVGNLKICGILIENSIVGQELASCVAGIGLNVNQERFVSDAPNPVSLFQLTGRRYDVGAIVDEVSEAILNRFSRCRELHNEYLGRLWRRSGLYLWEEPGGEPFEASIADVAMTGHLTLRLADGTLRRYSFKEVRPVGYKN